MYQYIYIYKHICIYIHTCIYIYIYIYMYYTYTQPRKYVSAHVIIAHASARARHRDVTATRGATQKPRTCSFARTLWTFSNTLNMLEHTGTCSTTWLQMSMINKWMNKYLCMYRYIIYNIIYNIYNKIINLASVACAIRISSVAESILRWALSCSCSGPQRLRAMGLVWFIS